MKSRAHSAFAVVVLALRLERCFAPLCSTYATVVCSICSVLSHYYCAVVAGHIHILFASTLCIM